MSSYHLEAPFLSTLKNVPYSVGGFAARIGGLAGGAVYSERDAVDALVQPGGANGAEGAPLLHIVGHSTSMGPIFITRSANNGVAAHGEVAWGSGKLRWVIIDGCSTLNPQLPMGLLTTNIFNTWGTTFRGIRGLYGFASISNSERSRGGHLADHLANDEPIWLAWLKACQETDTAVCAMLVANTFGVVVAEEGLVADGTPGADDALLVEATPVLPGDTWPAVSEDSSFNADEGLVYFLMTS